MIVEIHPVAIAGGERVFKVHPNKQTGAEESQRQQIHMRSNVSQILIQVKSGIQGGQTS